MLKLLTRKFISRRALARLLPWLQKTFTLTGIALIVLGFSPVISGEPAKTQAIPPQAAEAVTPRLQNEVQTEVTFAEADNRILKLQAYLETKGSPLAPYAGNLVAAADKYGLDWRLLAAISGVESGYAKIYVRGTYNAWGWGGGYIGLGNWPNAIEVISKALRERYADRWGATTVTQIGPIWAEDPNWAKKVTTHLGMIDAFVNAN